MNHVIKFFIQTLILIPVFVVFAIGQIQPYLSTTDTTQTQRVILQFSQSSLTKTKAREAVDASIIFHITNTKISIELNNNVTFKALQATFFHVPSADVDHMTSIFSDSRAQLNTDTLILLLVDYSGDTLVPGHYIIAEIPVTIIYPDSVSLGRVTAAGSNNQEITNTDTIVTTVPVAVLSEKGKMLPIYFALSQNYPNPFNPSTDINISISHTSQVLFTIYNMLGQEIRTLFDGQMQPGERTLQWDGRDQRGQGLASGIYVYRMVAGNFIETKKMILLK